MRNEFVIVVFSFCLIFGIGFMMFNSQVPSLTGYVVDNSSFEEEVPEIQIEVTKVIVDDAILESELIIEEINESGFSTVYMKDVLLEANKIFQQAKYAEVLRSGNASDYEIKEATSALTLINWKDIDYEDVLIYTEEIKQRKEQAYLIFDSIGAVENRLESYESLDLTSVEIILENAKTSFYEDRYDEAEGLLEQLKEELELKEQEASFIGTLQKSSKNFFSRYWVFILIFLVVLGVAGFFSYRQIYKRYLEKEINKKIVEQKVLKDLMIKVQTQRFKENSISEFVYKVRFKKYKDKLSTIKQELPVLEERLRKMKRVQKKEEIVVRKLKKSKIKNE
jgi:hypothetical protein